MIPRSFDFDYLFAVVQEVYETWFLSLGGDSETRGSDTCRTPTGKRQNTLAYMVKGKYSSSPSQSNDSPKMKY